MILLLRAFQPTTGREICNTIMQGTEKEHVELMRRESKKLPYALCDALARHYLAIMAPDGPFFRIFVRAQLIVLHATHARS